MKGRLYERRVLAQLTVDRGFYLRFKLSIYAMIFEHCDPRL